jgi:hypothetical protein
MHVDFENLCLMRKPLHFFLLSGIFAGVLLSGATVVGVSTPVGEAAAVEAWGEDRS